MKSLARKIRDSAIKSVKSNYKALKTSVACELKLKNSPRTISKFNGFP